jgi:Ni,Fe-hydrogenase III small subunit
MLRLLTNEINRKKAMKRPVFDDELLRLHRMLKREIVKTFSSCLKLYIIDTGSCNACELELQNLFNPFYDISKVGIEVVYHIEEADMLLLTGLVTENMYEELTDIYGRLKSPKHLILVGDCPLGESVFKNSFVLKGYKKQKFSTSYSIAGCPPEPRALIKGILKYLESL